ncbi:zinc-dependent peptidase [Celeribacter sp.]|uniref:M90 family metallopeptidase n=1 Tax=Celeribacter sp. TaxID=1890673 RepID=UPI003A905676
MPLLALLIIVGVLLFFGGRFIVSTLHKRRLLRRPLTADQRAIIAACVPLSRRLPTALRPRYEGKINLFLDQVEVFGYEGVEVTEAMRLSIAAQACLLIAGTTAWYDSLRTILLYPSAFRSMQKRREGYVIRERNQTRLGESWRYGPVILSWQHSREGAEDANDGKNVVIHEFAHQLDGLSGDVNGVPTLAQGQSFAQWEAVFLDAYTRLVADVARGTRSVIDGYGATNHQEFFAVCTEVFFERPADLKAEEPALYAQFSTLFQMDPAAW